ncbi:MAG: alpha/beta hydrolase, partial [Prevotella nanceiensis]|nr:alpha/beta hydrolase [Hoylesella nanceiensis]
MKKPLKRITIAVVSVLLLLLVAGSFFMTTYALKAHSNRVEQQEDTW